MTDTSTDIHRPGLVERLLRVRLFYKILLANAAIVTVGAVAGTLFTRAVIRSGSDFPMIWIIGLALFAVLVTLLVNAAILRVALSPLKLLEQTAARVQSGDRDARVPYSPLRDRELDRLTRTFNGMLDTLESYHHRLSGMAIRALNAQEEERKRIARELHDDTAQSLAALLIRLRLLRGADDRQVREATLDELRAEIGDALERIRRFAKGLRPPALDELGLVPALESHARGLSESVGVAIRVDAEPHAALSPEAELALYRIAQEAISNAVRHANAQRVVVHIAGQHSQVLLSVADDGGGFDVERAMATEERGLGLFGMRERAAYLGAQVSIQSIPGSGTEVRVTLPAEVDFSPRPEEAREAPDDGHFEG
ncbi:MAG: HAMP domain-containing protein [Gemmatimonas sp.]|nr:HAMP domain-containing protein [Gemmatimonas sp.]